MQKRRKQPNVRMCFASYVERHIRNDSITLLQDSSARMPSTNNQSVKRI